MINIDKKMEILFFNKIDSCLCYLCNKLSIQYDPLSRIGLRPSYFTHPMCLAS